MTGSTGFGASSLPLEGNWQFHLGKINEAPPFVTSKGNWIPLTLPHDWSIGLPRTADAPAEGAGGFFQTGTGCYQTTFRLTEEWQGKQVYIHFEGIARKGEVWLNGKRLGLHVNPYTPARFDLTPHLDYNRANTLSVVVDNSEEPASRWYVGSGLYRPVWLEAVGSVHLIEGGLYFRTVDIKDGTAHLSVEAEVANTGDKPVVAGIALSLNKEGLNRIASPVVSVPVEAHSSATARIEMKVNGALLWSPENPHLYELVATVTVDEAIVDRHVTSVGIRTISTSPEQGLLLNGIPTKLMGCNVHHDYGILGAAVHEGAALRKARSIKQAGFNAVRTSHNPPSTAFLDACDKLGLLVMDEAYDTWKVAKMKQDYHKYFEENWKTDLETFVRRDRNHPSVILWSTGNEMFDRGKAYAPALSAEMVAEIKRLDPTRPVTAGINGLGKAGDWTDLDPLFATFDVAGYNYELHRHAEDRARVPDRLIIAAETYLVDAFESWQIVMNNPYVLGEFIWSGLDYLGEAGIGRNYAPGETPHPHWEGNHFPWHGAACGDIDLIGIRKPISHYRNILWDRGEKLYMAVEEPAPDGGKWQTTAWGPPPLQASWTWPTHAGRDMSVEVYARYDLVRLRLNGKLVGEQAVSEDTAFKAVFTVPYEPGRLTAEGLTNGVVSQTFTLQTAEAPTGLWLSPSLRTLTPGSREIIFVDIQVVDSDFRNHPQAEIPVTYKLSGPGELIAIGSGDLTTTETYMANPRQTYRGRSLIAIRPTGEAGDIRLTASGPGLTPASVTLFCR
ncbi:MAG TPA: glycoside hydrolase family 2 TIM barrel-domain containing protein [Oceanipulchritudo sp.]|nr:glycoside hydrolase family 2 TIM barrel-domain containing protein [Oceanipulchritudo sp.]